MASSRLVLPCPLSPETTLKRGCASSVSCARLRNESAWRATMRTPALALAWAREVELLEPVDERAARDAEQLRGLGLIAEAAIKRLEDPPALRLDVAPEG